MCLLVQRVCEDLVTKRLLYWFIFSLRFRVWSFCSNCFMFASKVCL